MSLRITLLTLLAIGAVSISSGPGPERTGTITDSASTTGSMTTAAPVSFNSTSTCSQMNFLFETFCCVGELLYPMATGSPQPSYTTDMAVAAAALSEPNAIVPSHTLPILPGTSLASGVTCFGAVYTVPASESASVSTSVSCSSGIEGCDGTSTSSVTSTSTSGAGATSSSAAAATGASSSGAIVGSSTPAGSFTTSAAPNASGAAARDGAAGSFVGGLVGLVVALL